MATWNWIGLIILGIIAFFLFRIFSGDSAED
jgi:uncharacterized membrane protein YdjX (TVP38/TMEM64 family)